MSENLNSEQPDPTLAVGDTWQLVIADMQERREVGIRRYGTTLQPDNGRDSLIDAYQEALDLAVYLRNEIEKRRLDNKTKVDGSFAVGDCVCKVSGDYGFRGVVVEVLTKQSGTTRFVVENKDGVLFIFNGAQLALDV
jgi:hypothetical protein